MGIFNRRKPQPEPVPVDPPATNAQIGYIISLMNELELDELGLTWSNGTHVTITRDMIPGLRKGDASQVITALLAQR